MATAVQAVLTRLQNDGSFVTYISGGVWNRDIKRVGRGSTPLAFDENLYLRPSAAVEGGDEIGGSRLIGEYMDQVTIHFYCPSDDQRKQVVTNAYERAIRLIYLATPDPPGVDLTPWWYVNDDGRRMFPIAHSATRFYPSEVFVGSSEKLVTFRFRGSRASY